MNTNRNHWFETKQPDQSKYSTFDEYSTQRPIHHYYNTTTTEIKDIPLYQKGIVAGTILALSIGIVYLFWKTHRMKKQIDENEKRLGLLEEGKGQIRPKYLNSPSIHNFPKKHIKTYDSDINSIKSNISHSTVKSIKVNEDGDDDVDENVNGYYEASKEDYDDLNNFTFDDPLDFSNKEYDD